MASELNRTVRGALGSSGATVGPYRFRRSATTYDTVRVMLYTPAGGAWSGTITLQTSDPDQNAWVNEVDGDFTADTAYVFEPGGDCDIRWKFTTYTSGTAIGAIVGG